MDVTKVEKAATLSLARIEESLPSSLLVELEKVGKSLSVPWVGILVGSWTPIQYVMGYSEVELENTDWVEPTILWSLMHMPSGTRKSLIYKFVNDLVAGLGNNIEEDGSAGEPTPQYKVNETTFEKLGLIMASNEGKVVWYFDEGRHFFSQLGMYQKGSSRDESVLLTLYDAGEWNHSTAKGVQFALNRTNLALGGLTQTAHISQLFNNKEQMESGLIPRFLTVMLKPVHTSIRDMQKGSTCFKTMIIETLGKVKELHRYHIVHTMFRKSKSFEMFATYHEQVSKWIEKHQYKLHDNYQNAITMVSKSLGQIFRLAGILNSFFLCWNLDEVIQFEQVSMLAGNVPDFEEALRNVGCMVEDESRNVKTADEMDSDAHKVTVEKYVVPISLMALQSAMSIVTHSLTQNLILQQIELLEFDFTTSLPKIRDVQLQTDDTQTVTNTSIVTNDVAKPIAPNLPVPSGSNSVITSPQVTAIDVGKVLVSGGKVLSGSYLNRYRKIGSQSNSNVISLIFNVLENSGFGIRQSPGNFFLIYENILEIVRINEDMKGMMVTMGVSISMLQEAINKPNNRVPVPAKKSKRPRDDGDDISSKFPQFTNLSLPLENGEMLSQITERL